jgi:hypothetical protein
VGFQGGGGVVGVDVESPHVLADSFRADKNGCRVSRRKDEEGGGSEEVGTRGLKEGERWRGGSERGKYRGQTRTGQGKGGVGSEGARQIEL